MCGVVGCWEQALMASDNLVKFKSAIYLDLGLISGEKVKD